MKRSAKRGLSRKAVTDLDNWTPVEARGTEIGWILLQAYAVASRFGDAGVALAAVRLRAASGLSRDNSAELYELSESLAHLAPLSIDDVGQVARLMVLIADAKRGLVTAEADAAPRRTAPSRTPAGATSKSGGAR